MTTIHLLALAGYFLILAEYISMRHRFICAESDREILYQCDGWSFTRWPDVLTDNRSAILYCNRGTK